MPEGDDTLERFSNPSGASHPRHVTQCRLHQSHHPHDASPCKPLGDDTCFFILCTLPWLLKKLIISAILESGLFPSPSCHPLKGIGQCFQGWWVMTHQFGYHSLRFLESAQVDSYIESIIFHEYLEGLKPLFSFTFSRSFEFIPGPATIWTWFCNSEENK